MSDTMELYQITELELYHMLKDSYYPDLVKVADEFSSNDCISNDFEIYVELKCRQTHYNDLLIEKIKYDRIKEEADMQGYIPIYICSTPEGIWEFNLDVLNIKWEGRDNLPATTEFHNTERVTKTVGYLNIKNGKKLFPNWPEDNQPEDDWFTDNFEKFYAEDAWVDPMEKELGTAKDYSW